MNLEKKTSALWNKFLCFLLGHTHTVICERCGKLVYEETNFSLWWKIKKGTLYQYKNQREYKGSIRFRKGMIKYALNMKTNELRKLDYEIETEMAQADNCTHSIKHRVAKYNPLCVYIDAINDENAIRKANNYLFGIKQGVRITHITK